MPDVIIKGMEMPENCRGCQFMKIGVGDWKGEFWCSAIRFQPLTNIDKRPDWCPLSPVPEWISVKERPPDSEGYYYTATRLPMQNQIAWFYSLTPYPSAAFQRPDILFWRPLPEPPEEGQLRDD